VGSDTGGQPAAGKGDYMRKACRGWVWAAALTFPVVAAGVAPVRGGQGAAAEDGGLLAAEQEWAQSLETADVDRLARLIDHSFTFVGPDGEYEEREAYLAGYREAYRQGLQVESVDSHEVRLRILGDTGIVTGRVEARVRMQGRDFAENVRFTRVYRRRDGRWRMVAGQGTRLTAER
jgi:ketosteroid isomerase-like protein